MAPRGKDDRLGGTSIGSGNKLTEEEVLRLREINAKRRPSERVGEGAICGARISEEALERRRNKGKPLEPICQLGAGYGTSHQGIGYCKFHGGNTDSGKKHAARVYGQSIIEKERDEISTDARFERFGGDRRLVQISPEEALLEEVRRSVALVRWLEERIAQWQWQARDPDTESELGHPIPSLGGLPALVDETTRGAATFTDEREWLLLYRAEREHAAKVAKMTLDAGVAQRLVTLAEDQGRMLASAIRAVLDALQLTPTQLELVPQVVPQVLRSATQGIPLPAATTTSPR